MVSVLICKELQSSGFKQVLDQVPPLCLGDPVQTIYLQDRVLYIAGALITEIHITLCVDKPNVPVVLSPPFSCLLVGFSAALLKVILMFAHTVH